MIKMPLLIKENRWIVWAVLLVLLLLGVYLTGRDDKSQPVEGAVKSTASDIGISVGGADQQAYLARLEKDYYDFEDRVKGVESKVKEVRQIADRMETAHKNITQSLVSMDQGISIKMEQKFQELKGLLESQGAKSPTAMGALELTVAHIKEAENGDWVYLPLGSFCKGTLLTGVYAAADINNPLPVLIALDEAFYGPNKTRVPLKDAFLLGKAYGDLTSERALIQIVAISAVLPDGSVFEKEQDLGYVTDELGELGIKGRVVYNTGRQLALSFMGGFVAGGAQAVADTQITTHRSAQGEMSRDVTGSASKNAIFSGIAGSSGRLAEFYERQAQELIPAVHVRNGVSVNFIVQKGVSIHGLSARHFDHRTRLD